MRKQYSSALFILPSDHGLYSHLFRISITKLCHRRKGPPKGKALGKYGSGNCLLVHITHLSHTFRRPQKNIHSVLLTINIVPKHFILKLSLSLHRARLMNSGFMGSVLCHQVRCKLDPGADLGKRDHGVDELHQCTFRSSITARLYSCIPTWAESLYVGASQILTG